MQSARPAKPAERNELEILVSMAIFYVGFGISFHLNRYLAHHLDIDGLGDMHVALTVATIAAAFAVLGGQAAVHRFVPRYLSEANWQLAKGFIRHYLLLALILCCAAVALGLLTATAFHLLSLEAWQHETSLAIIITPLIALSLFTGATVQSLRRPFAALLPNEVLKPALFWIGCMLWLELFTTFNEYEVIGILFSVVCVQLAVQAYFIRTSLPFDWKSTPPAYDKGNWHSVSRPLLYSTLANTLLDRIDILALEILHPDEDGVGVFALLVFLVSPIWMNFSAASSVIAPRIATLGRAELQGLYGRTLASTLLANLLVAALIAIFADPILTWLHDDMTAYKPWLFAMLVGTALNCSLETASPFIRYGGYQDKVARLATAILLANLIVTPAAIYFLGLQGAIVSIIGMSFLRGVSYAYVLRRYVGLRPLHLV